MPEQDVDEAGLIAALQAGDEAAYESLVTDHGGRMLAVARRMLNNEDEAQDAVQEAFLSAFKAIGRFKADAKLSTWLHRIVVNACLMRIRTRRRRPERSIEDMLPRFNDEGHRVQVGPTWDEAPDAGAMADDLREQIYESMADLPEDYRNVLLLRDIEGLNTRDAASVLDVTEGAVKIRLHRARQALREQLVPHVHGGLS